MMNTAMTLDGKIATKSGDSNISTAADLNQLHRLRARVDAVMIGSDTQLSDNPLLTVRRVKDKNPIRIVVDSLAKTPSNSRVLSAEGNTIIAVSRRATESRVKKLELAGAKVICCGTDHVNLKTLLRKLQGLGIRSILLEGGGGLNWYMLANDLVDELRITIAPFLVGGERAKTLVEGIGVGKMGEAIKLSLRSMMRNGNELVLAYKVE
jgi:2,5-diamino-6-(ribosylamino)-4(3H)-pyrimidinone 5'-phosphate reductase